MEKFVAYENGDYIRDDNEKTIVIIAPDYDTAEKAFINAVANMCSGFELDRDKIIQDMEEHDFHIRYVENDWGYNYHEGDPDIFCEYNYDEF